MTLTMINKIILQLLSEEVASEYSQICDLVLTIFDIYRWVIMFF